VKSSEVAGIKDILDCILTVQTVFEGDSQQLSKLRFSLLAKTAPPVQRKRSSIKVLCFQKYQVSININIADYSR
jgi:hypothetical protein